MADTTTCVCPSQEHVLAPTSMGRVSREPHKNVGVHPSHPVPIKHCDFTLVLPRVGAGTAGEMVHVPRNVMLWLLLGAAPAPSQCP